METNSTQAVEADTTLNATPVKRWKRGDVREDGMVFWKHDARFSKGEWWKPADRFHALVSRDATFEKRDRVAVQRGPVQAHWARRIKESGSKHSRGDVREDGKIFWGYDWTRKNGERWMTPTQYAAAKANQIRKKALLRVGTSRLSGGARLRQGMIREDGKIFWSYDPASPDGQYWVTAEQFANKRAKANARKRERRATDPLYALKHRLRNRVSSALKRKGFKKNTKTAILLGCTYEEFKAHIERLFLPGMTWANFSDGHLDHIVPLDAADTEADVYALNHFTNLRPMWGRDNCSKNAKIPEEHELPADLHDEVRKIWQRAKYSACVA